MRILICVCLVFSHAYAQSLDGNWMFIGSPDYRGKYHPDAVPYFLTIKSEERLFIFKSLVYNGRNDSLVIDTLIRNDISDIATFDTLKKKVSFSFDRNTRSWIKSKNVRHRLDDKQLNCLEKESYSETNDGKYLYLFKEFIFEDSTKGENNYSSFALYEKVKSEKLSVGEEQELDPFLRKSSLEKILNRAKRENKFVLVYLSNRLSRSCRAMDKFVLSCEKVSKCIANDFIPVKIQLDTGLNGTARSTLSWIPREEFDYSISEYPVFLFFSPTGTILHCEKGQQGSDEFVRVLEKVKDPQNQLYTLLRNAKSLKYPLRDYPELARRMREEFNRDNFATEVANIYYVNYLHRFSDFSMLVRSNLAFVRRFIGIVKTDDRLFKLCVEKPVFIDSIMQFKGGGWAQDLVDQVIEKEVFSPFRKLETNQPNWEQLEKQLRKVVSPKLASVYLQGEMVSWYWHRGDYSSTFKYLEAYLASLDLDKVNPMYLNACAWLVYQHSNDSLLINKSLEWINSAVKRAASDLLPMFMDTKACLLYKSGRKGDGISIMRQIGEKFPERKQRVAELIALMNKGERIWELSN